MTKRRYEKPTVEKVELKPEEAALTACKLSSAIGPHPSGNQPCTRGFTCSAPTS